jgi:hypothetical protein
MLRRRWPHFTHRNLSFSCCFAGIAALSLLLPQATCRADSPLQERIQPTRLLASTRMVERMEGMHQQPPVDLTELSLEQLLNLEITPVNVLGAHTHHKGEFMFGYHYMNMNMVGNLNGTRSVSIAEILADYPVAHTDMRMEMHMFEAMYALSDKSTLMLMLPYKENSMNHINRAGVRFPTTSHGIGDLELMGNYTFFSSRNAGHRLLVNAGVSFPTGGINLTHPTPTNPNAKLEYMMQLGSGTYDLMPGVTYMGERGNWAWGAQALGTIRLGRNENHYALGDRLTASLWGYYKVTDSFAPSLRLEYNHWGDVRGADPELDPTANPAFDAGLQRGSRLNLLFGFNLYTPRGPLKGHRFSLELGVPIYQSLAGPNNRTDFQWMLGWSYTY